jgi:ethanolamine permease
LGKDSLWAKAFASLGLFGLIASFHCNTLGYSRQIYALARDGYLPSILSKINPRFSTPHWALLAGGAVGMLALVTGSTVQVITLSVLGALVMYITSMLSLLALRRSEPALERPFKTPFYPYFPIIALLLSILCLASVIYFNKVLSIMFFGTLLVSLLLFWQVGIRYVKRTLRPLSER